MKKKDLNIFVITRFGLGQSLDSFYNNELPYIENLLTKSIINQKDHITKWIILMDINTPDFVRKKLINLVPEDLLYIYSQDPFLEGSTMPNLSIILNKIGVKKNDKVITIRVDADDMISNDFISSVVQIIDNINYKKKYSEILVNPVNGIYFYPIRKRLVKVFKEDYSIQVLYSIYGKDFHTVYDYPHKNIGQKVLDNGGFYYRLENKDLWLRSLRQHSITRFGKKFGVLDGRLDLLKNFIKFLMNRFIRNTSIYKKKVKVKDISKDFEITKNVISALEQNEKTLTGYNLYLSPMVKNIIHSNGICSKFKIKKILLDLYKNEVNEEKKSEIKKNFYSF